MNFDLKSKKLTSFDLKKSYFWQISTLKTLKEQSKGEKCASVANELAQLSSTDLWWWGQSVRSTCRDCWWWACCEWLRWWAHWSPSNPSSSATTLRKAAPSRRSSGRRRFRSTGRRFRRSFAGTAPALHWRIRSASAGPCSAPVRRRFVPASSAHSRNRSCRTCRPSPKSGTGSDWRSAQSRSANSSLDGFGRF